MQRSIKSSILIFLALISTVALGQRSKFTDKELNKSGVKRVVFYSNSPSEVVALAEEDIGNKMPFLILKGGLAPVAYTTDSEFEKRFNISYWEEGCVSPPVACMNTYNQRIFQFLEEKYGRTWLKSVRKDVIGLREWKKKPRF